MDGASQISSAPDGQDRMVALAAVRVLPSRTKVTKVSTEMRTGVVAHRYTHRASRYLRPEHNNIQVSTEMRTGMVAHRYTHRASRYLRPEHNNIQ